MAPAASAPHLLPSPPLRSSIGLVKVFKACHWLTRATDSAANEAPVIDSERLWNGLIFFFPPVSHIFSGGTIGVRAGCSLRTWLFITNSQQFVHRTAHAVHYTPQLPYFSNLSPPLHSPTTPCSPPFRNPSSSFPLILLPSSPCLTNGAISPYWGHWPGSSRKVPLAAAECISMG